MTNMQKLAAFAATTWMAVAALPTLAGPGHDHGDTPAVSSGLALPRFAAASETFELVGVVNGKRLTLYLDHYADGSPVGNARLELELGGVKIPVESHGEGEFEAFLEEELPPGVLAVSAMVIAGAEPDLLIGELDIHDETSTGKAGHDHHWQEYAAWAGGGALLTVFLLLLLTRVRNTRFRGAR
jgi:hypothetical protein